MHEQTDSKFVGEPRGDFQFFYVRESRAALHMVASVSDCVGLVRGSILGPLGAGREMTPDEQLMRSVKLQMAPFIRPAIEGTPYPESLLAALVGNESGGNLAAGRFEPQVFWELSFTLIGRKGSFGSITAEQLKQYVGAAEPDKAVAALVNLATSAGPTQIMGYQALAGGYPLAELYNLRTHFLHAVRILEAFGKQFNLSIPEVLRVDYSTFAAFFRCWNTGRPDGQTFDPKYVDNGLARMAIYEALA
jgi:hypothetical protein